MAIDRIPQSEYESRRKKVLAALKGAVGLLCAGKHDPHSDTPFRPLPHFEYLAGVVDEPGAILLLDPTQPVASRRSSLFLRPLNPEREKWDGYRLEIAGALREKTGFSAVHRTDAFPRMLSSSARRARKLACLHPPALITQPVTPDLDFFRKIAERSPGMSIEDRTDLLDKMRAVKSRNEHTLMQRAVDITTVGFDAMLGVVRPGVSEFEVQEAIEHAYRTNGSRQASFPTIVGSGHNTTVLHYVANDQTIQAGELVLVDSGAVFGGYAADITRTVPADGKFTTRQKEIYELVLRAENASIKAVKPGATWAQIDQAARTIIDEAGYGDFFIHSIGHHLGLETHDVAPDEPLKTGAVVTIEPGIYIPDEDLGVRIEDDVLVTQQGQKVLSAKIPKTVAAIEKAMSG